ncbi:MAG: LPS export ABC transporter periplasmic protein LptC [Fusobacteriaceae bacterium]
MKMKKLLYILGFAAVTVLGYLNYFSDETLEKGKETVIETKLAKYVSEEYKIDADNQKDYMDKKETLFEKAKATLKDTLLTGDSVLLDSARNLILKNNILGKTANGWNFNTESLKYDKSIDRITTDTGISASNEELGIKIKGDKLNADSKMTDVNLIGNVVMENPKMDITSDLATYSNVDKKMLVQGNVKLVGKNYPQKLMGDFGTLVYDSNNKEITADEEFVITYGDIVFKGKYFKYNQEKDTLIANKDLVIVGKDYTITLDKITKDSDSDILNLGGKIIGTGTEYSFSADSGKYNLKTKELELVNNVEIKNKNNDEFKGERVVYSEITGILEGFGVEEPLVYKSQNRELMTSYLNYDTNTEILNLNKGFQFKDKTYFGKGEKLVYNKLANDAIVENVEINSETRKMVTSELDYNGNEKKVNIPKEFIMTNKDGTEKLISKNGVFYTEKNILQTEEAFEYFSGETVATGTGIIYNTLTGAGESIKGIIVENKLEKTLMTGDKIILKNKDTAELVGNVKFSGMGYKTSVKKAEYSISKNILKINERVKIVSSEKNEVIEMDNPLIDLTKTTLTGKNFNLKDDAKTITSPQATYNYKTGEIDGKNIKMVTDKNETFTGNKLSGNFISGIIDITGDVKARIYDNDEPIDFSGKFVKVYLDKTGSGSKIKKIEVRENSTIKNKETTLYSKNIDVDTVKKIAEVYPNPVAILKDVKNGDTEVTSKTATFNMGQNRIYMNEGVNFKNINPEKGTTTGVAGSGIVNTTDKTLELKEKPVIDSPDAIIRADKMIYNSVTRKLNATGNVVVDYKEKK